MSKLNKNQSGFGTAEGIMILVILVLIGVVGWLVYKNHNKTTPASATTTTPASTTTPIPSTTPAVSKDKTYKDSKSKITFTYPSGWKVVSELPSIYKTDYSSAASSWASPIAKCSGPFLINESDEKQIISIDVSDSNGEGGYCYSYGDFSKTPKWNGGDVWEGSYFVNSGISKKSGAKYGYVFLFNYKTNKLLGKDVLTKVADSFSFY